MELTSNYDWNVLQDIDPDECWVITYRYTDSTMLPEEIIGHPGQSITHLFDTLNIANAALINSGYDPIDWDSIEPGIVRL